MFYDKIVKIICRDAGAKRVCSIFIILALPSNKPNLRLWHVPTHAPLYTALAKIVCK